jgi:hypothetical protein
VTTPEQVERALRSWDTAEPFRPHGRLGKHLDVDEIAALARHVAACLSSEPARFEVTTPIVEQVRENVKASWSLW